jgi:hypothetical protein
MPIPISAFQKPELFRLEDRYPMSYEKEDRFNEICPRHFAGRYRGDVGREGGWKYSGYNPNHQSTRTETFRIRSDNITLKPY